MLEGTVPESFIDVLMRFSRKRVKELLEMQGMFSKSKDLAKTAWSGIGSKSLPLFLRVKLFEIFMAVFAEWTRGLNEGKHQEKLRVSCSRSVNLFAMFLS